MTKEQLDILIKDGDIVPLSGSGQFYFPLPGQSAIVANYNIKDELIEIKGPNFLKHPTNDFYETVNFQRFNLGERIHEILDEIFNWYVEILMKEFKEKINISLDDRASKQLKLLFLNETIQNEFKAFEELRNTKPFEYIERLDDLQNCWFLLIENEHLISLIDYLKFYVFNGKKIPDEWQDEQRFYLFEQYFNSEKLRISYNGMGIERRIKFLQGKINEIEKEPSIEKAKIKGTEAGSISKIFASQNKFCPSMPIEFARSHFDIMTTTLNKNGVPFLDKEDLDKFIKRAFSKDMSVEKINLNYGKKERLFIVKRFYEFYLEGSSKYEKTIQCKRKYLELLTNNFENWNYGSVKNNFGNKVKREW